MKPKEKELLSQLYQNQNRYLTARELAEVLHISERTVRTYIRRMESEVSQNGGEILARQGNGYRLVLKRPVQFAVLAGTPGTETVHRQPDVPDSSQERRRYLMQRMLLDGEKLDLEDTAALLYVSTGTLKKEMTQLRGLLEEYSLSLETDREGASIAGEETSKRALIMDYFFRSSSFSSIQEYMDHSGYFDDIPTEQMLRLILDESRQFGIRLSDVTVQNALLHLALSVKRMQAGLKPEAAIMTPGFEESLEYQAARAIFRRLAGMIDGEFPPEEISYLALHLAGKGTWKDYSTGSQPQDLEQEAITVLRQLAEDDVMQLDGDQQLISSLLEHLRPMTVRLQRGLPQKNPLTEAIVRDEPELMKIIRKYFGAMPSLRRYDIDDDEWAYLALHVMAALERQKEKKKLQVLVVCATGYGSSQLLKSRLMKHFSDSLHIVTETGYYEMSDDILQGIDLIISSVNIGPVIFGVPFIHVSVFLSEEDVQNIQHFIDQAHAGHETDRKEKNRSRAVSRNQQEIFDCYFSEEDFRIYPGHPDRDQVMNDLVETLASYEKDSFADHLREQIKLRAQMGSVVFSDEIAVPHPAVPLSRVARLAVALIPGGMYWNEIHPAVRFVFLMSPSYVENRNLPRVTGAIVTLMDEPVLQEKILQSGTFDAFGRTFSSLIEAA